MLKFKLDKKQFYLEKITKLYFDTPTHFREMSSGILKTALTELLGKCENSESAKLFGLVRDYICKNYHDTELSNSTIASHFGYHPYYLANLIKLTTGKSLHRHISDYRISLSEEMLLTSETDIAQISWKCGFSSVSYFIKMFRDKNACTPLQYRKTFTSY